MTSYIGGEGSAARTRVGHGDELLVAQTPQARPARPLLADEDTHDRPRDDDRAEHRRQYADDQDQREAADHGRPEGVEDRGGDEARHVRVEDGVPRALETGLHG